MERLLALAGLIGFFSAIALLLVKAHLSEHNEAKLTDLVLDKYGHFDIAAVAFWMGYIAAIWIAVYCTLKGVPEGLAGLYPTFCMTVVAPLVSKVIFKGKPPVLPEIHIPELPKAVVPVKKNPPPV